MTEVALAIPDKVKPFAGQIIDTDTHEALPINLWHDRYGSLVDDFVQAIKVANWPAAHDIRDADDVAMDDESVWKVKRFNAPGAFDFERRKDLMNMTGVGQQIVFPGTLGLLSGYFFANAHNPNVFKAISGSIQDRKLYASKLIGVYNEWVARTARESSRYAAVAILSGETPADLLAEAKRLIKLGVRGLWMPSSTLPGGASPAHSVHDPLWQAMSEADVPLLAHLGTDHGFLATEGWRDAPAFDGFRHGEELSLDPWTLATTHRATENFLTTLIMGGVFERHPGLRYGAMEVGGDWLGPLAEHLDIWIKKTGLFSGKDAKRPELSMAPAEYIRRNVRVGPFGFEDVGRYIKMYGLAECYCYQSDFPHIEGGWNPMGEIVSSFERAGLGDDVLKMFFVDNAKLIVPH
jgi:predicted TIM-barrel fold metal-dependent hydrolase